MEFEDYLDVTSKEIEKVLKKFLAAFRKDVNRESKVLLHLIDDLIDSFYGGKYLRGSLVKLGYEIIGSKPTQEILKPAAAYTIVHGALLIHDDIIDQSPLRRGKLSLYKKLGGNHYGISQALVLGDLGFFLSFKLIHSADFPIKYKLSGFDSFIQILINTGLGESLGIEYPKLGIRAENDVLKIDRLKTGHYTIMGPLKLGAILGGADGKLLNSLKSFGENLGIAFQIQDDILGVFGSEKQTGKSVTSDIEEGKNTLLIVYALKNASQAQKKILEKYYGKKNISKNGLDQVRNIFRETGALDYSRQQAVKYVERAKKIIPELTSDPKYVKLLNQLADFLINREY